MKLSEWAKKRGITYKTAALGKRGQMPVPFEVTPTGTILVRLGRRRRRALSADMFFPNFRFPSGRERAQSAARITIGMRTRLRICSGSPRQPACRLLDREFCGK
ncbi:hypothetical protein AB1399_01750 [Hydrogenibacillus schlegelii]|uniref:hypothetical protein n=1 Tax=Hydrogenibacillus schlegelii TaxID=1484 RepID=UPI001FDFDA70|nr:hypothetical protein [Hydrogenibacillus schlegelii]